MDQFAEAILSLDLIEIDANSILERKLRIVQVDWKFLISFLFSANITPQAEFDCVSMESPVAPVNLLVVLFMD